MSTGDDKPRAASWRLKDYLFLGLILFLLAGLFPGLIGLLEVLFRCVIGWAVHLWVMVPVLLPQWRGLLLPLACVAISLWLGHGFIRWALAAKNERRPWKFSQTAAIFGLLLLGSGAAIAMSGIVHQLAWLAKEPVMQDRFDRFRERDRAMSKVVELIGVVEDFRKQEGRYPDSLDELARLRPEAEPLLWIEVSRGAAPEKVIYLKPPAGEGKTEPANGPLLVSPALLPDGRAVVARGDRSTTLQHRAKVEEILQAAAGHGN